MGVSILVNNMNAMLVTQNEMIMQHSKNVHTISIYVPETYNSFDMNDFMATVEVIPPNQEYKVVTLTAEEESGKEGYIKYILTLNTDDTMFAGKLQMQMTFTNTDTSTSKTYVRKTQKCELTITPIAQWSTLIADSALTELDQRLVQIQAGISTMNTLAEAFNKTKADNVAINDDGDLQLKANGVFVGDAVAVVTPGTIDDEDSTQDGIIEADEIYI